MKNTLAFLHFIDLRGYQEMVCRMWSVHVIIQQIDTGVSPPSWETASVHQRLLYCVANIGAAMRPSEGYLTK